jgi:sulfoxide reductase heme-binding subunit YedZ
VAVFTFSLVPALLLAYGYIYDKLGINPFETLMNSTGFWGMFFLLLTLAVTPLRRWLTWLSTGLRLHYGKRL